MTAYQRVLAAPSSLAARKALAAEWRAAGDPRAELVEKQLAYREYFIANSMYHPDAIELRSDITDLIREHKREWSNGVASLVGTFAFHRGCVAEITVSGEQLPQVLPKLVELAPIQHINLVAPLALDTAFAVPAFAHITSLSIVGLHDGFGDAEAAALARSPSMKHLVWLQLTDNAIGEAGCTALVASPHLAHCAFVDTRANAVSITPEIVEINSLEDFMPSPLAARLQATYGARPWLATPSDRDHWPPERDELSVALRGDR